MPAQCFLVFSAPRVMEHTHKRFTMKTCASTGHSPKGLGYRNPHERCAALKEKLRSLIVKLIEEEGVTHFISGMAQGVDMHAAEIALG